MDLDGQIKLGHLLLQDRKCKKCGVTKNLVDGFYRTRKIEVQLHHHILMSVKTAQQKDSRKQEKERSVY